MATFTSRDGKHSVESNLELGAAIRILERIESNFSKDLRAAHARGKITEGQIVWVHILAIRQLEKEVEAEKPKEKFETIRDLFDHAIEKGGKRLKVKCTINDKTLCLSLAGSRSKNAGWIYVTDGGPFGDNIYYGKLNEAGEFHPAGRCKEIIDELREFAKDPVAAAKSHGALTGFCCFCSSPLKTKESVGVGYGPKCASKYGMPWGSTEEYDAKREEILA